MIRGWVLAGAGREVGGGRRQDTTSYMPRRVRRNRYGRGKVDAANIWLPLLSLASC
jgi:hypothetical protein